MGGPGLCRSPGRHGLSAGMARLRREQDHCGRGEHGSAGGRQAARHDHRASDSEQDAVVAEAQKDPKVRKFTDGMEIVKVILVKNKLVNLIVRPKR